MRRMEAAPQRSPFWGNGWGNGLARHTLTALKIKEAAPGKLEDGGGLRLLKKAEDAGSWVYRYSYLGRRREMGLGPWPALTLAAARRLRDRWEAELAAGRDPLSVREAERAAERAAQARRDPTLAEAADMVLAARAATLRDGGARGRWLSPLSLHVLPKIGKRAISTITPEDVRDVLRPIWRAKHPTALKAVERLRIVFAECKLMGLPADPFTVDAARRQLGAVIYRAEPTPATPWQDMPALYKRLGTGIVSHDCLRFTMLTLVRLNGTRRALASEIDGDVWTVPAERVKGREGRVEAFRVPLSPAALALVQTCAEAHGDVLFPGLRGEPITDRALEKALTVLGETGRPHGFRASFRTWAEDTGVPWEVAETILGHTIKGKVERAYARSDLLDRRRPVMEAWAAFLSS